MNKELGQNESIPKLPSTIVVKFGTELVTRDGELNYNYIRDAAREIVKIKRTIEREIKSIIQIVLVTSGAVAVGRKRLGIDSKEGETLPLQQIYAAAGQATLQKWWEECLAMEDIKGLQILLVRDVFENDKLCHDSEQTFAVMRRIPNLIAVSNTNDPTSVEELKNGDNDQLARRLAQLIRADIVLLLTTVPGVLRNIEDPASGIDAINSPWTAWEEHVDKKTSVSGSGGMDSKCREATILAGDGIRTVIADGRDQTVISKILLEGKNIGTVFEPVAKTSGPPEEPEGSDPIVDQ